MNGLKSSNGILRILLLPSCSHIYISISLALISLLRTVWLANLLAMLLIQRHLSENNMNFSSVNFRVVFWIKCGSASADDVRNQFKSGLFFVYIYYPYGVSCVVPPTWFLRSTTQCGFGWSSVTDMGGISKIYLPISLCCRRLCRGLLFSISALI